MGEPLAGSSQATMAGTRKVSPRAISAQAIRAILLTNARAMSLVGFFFSESVLVQTSRAQLRRLVGLSSAVAPQTSRVLR